MVCKEGRRKKQRNLTKQFLTKQERSKEPRKQNKPIKKSISDKTRQTMTLHYVALRWTRTRYHVIVVSHGIRRSCLFVHFTQFCLFAGTNVLPCLPQQFAKYKKRTREEVQWSTTKNRT